MRGHFLLVALAAANVTCRGPVSRPPRSAGPTVDATAAVAVEPRPVATWVGKDASSGAELAADEMAVQVRQVHRPAASGLVVVEPLAAERAVALLAMAPSLPPTKAAPASVAVLRPGPPPPAPAGQVIALPTPQVGTLTTAARPPPAVPATPLTAASLRVVPEGAVSSAALVQVAFDRPMVPLHRIGTHATPEVVLEPPAEGTWRWVDPRLLQFTAADRLAQATSYRVTVRKGVRAQDGAELTSEVAHVIDTPPVAISELVPSGATVRPDGAIAVRFNQRIAAADLAPYLRIAGGGGMRVLSPAEAERRWRQNPRLGAPPWEWWPTDTYVLLAPESRWPADATLTLSLLRGAPSAEGPKRSAAADSATFSTIPALKVLGIACRDGEDVVTRRQGARCATDEVAVQFSNPLVDATEGFRPQWVQVRDPRAPAAQTVHDVHNWGTELAPVYPFAVGRTYSLEIAAEVTDVFGQRLGAPVSVPVQTYAPRSVPWLSAPSGMQVLDPGLATPWWQVQAHDVASVRVRLYRVQPRDYPAFVAWQNAGSKGEPPGTRVTNQLYPVGKGYGGELRADLRPALTAVDGKYFGHVIAIAEARVVERRDAEEVTPHVAWLQVTRLGLSARLDRQSASALVTELLSARPMAGAKLTLWDGVAESTAVTDVDGGAALRLLPARAHARALLVAEQGADRAFHVLWDRWQAAPESRNVRWFVTDDRFTYRPGERVHFKGWLRVHGDGANPASTLPNREVSSVDYSVVDARGNKLAGGNVALSEQGGFATTVELPESAATGYARLELAARGAVSGRHVHPFRLAAFRRPSFEVQLETDTGLGAGAPLVRDEVVEATVAASYYGGGFPEGATVRWQLRAEPADFLPPGWHEFSFSQEALVRSSRGEGSIATLESTVGARGEQLVEASLHGRGVDTPQHLAVSAEVIDVDKTSVWAEASPVLVHPAAHYVGVRELAPGKLGVIVVDPAGKAVAGAKVGVAIDGYLPSQAGGEIPATPGVAHAACEVVSTTAMVTCEFPVNDAYAYVARAEVRDSRERVHRASVWLSGATPTRANIASSSGLQLSLDRRQYQPGATAQLTIRSDVFPARAHIAVDRQGLVVTRTLELTAAQTTVPLAVPFEYLPNATVWVDVVAAEPREGAPAPRALRASIELLVDAGASKLELQVRSAAPVVAPGGALTLEVAARLPDGKPAAGAEVAVWVVDEAVLALSTKRFAHPSSAFYPRVAATTFGFSTIDALLRASAAELSKAPGWERFSLAEQFSARGFGRGAGAAMGHMGVAHPGGGAGSVRARRDFRADALFVGALRTDAAGKAQVRGTMPDSTTRYRIVAMASHERYFGLAEASVVTRQLITARLVAPRFLRHGDRFELPVLVQNLTATTQVVELAVRARNLALEATPARRVTLPPQSRTELRIATQTEASGAAQLQVVLAAGAHRDVVESQLEVLTPASLEEVAIYGEVLDQPIKQRVELPSGVWPGIGELRLDLAHSQLAALTDAVLYLQGYPWECAEQVSARMIGMLELAPSLTMLGTQVDTAAVAARRALDRRRLQELQRADGGFGYWAKGRSDPFVTVQATHALWLDAPKAPATQRALAQVRTWSQRGRQRGARAAGASSRGASELSTQAYAWYVRALAGDSVAADVESGWRAQALDTAPLDAVSWSLLALSAQRSGTSRAHKLRERLLRRLHAAVVESAATATVAGGAAPFGASELSSAARTDALALLAILHTEPSYSVSPKLARGLLAKRVAGRWRSTQENLWVLSALAAFARIYEGTPADFTAEAWLGQQMVASQAFAGPTSAAARLELPWSELATTSSPAEVTLQKRGPGRLYYRLGMRYARKETKLGALDAGFSVLRHYVALDDPGDVEQRPDGSWRIARGARVAVLVEVGVTRRRFQVAVHDALPAGLEPIVPALATTGPVAASRNPWAEHEDIRDEQVAAFASELGVGTYTLLYTARAQTPGRFEVPPARAEAMYAPEEFGRSSSTVVVVE